MRHRQRPDAAGSSPLYPTVPASYKYGAEAIALLGIAYGLIKWVGRALRSLVSDSGLEASRLEGLAASSPAAIDALVRQGLVSREQLDGMSPRERQFLIANASRSAPTSAVTSSSRDTPRGTPPGRDGRNTPVGVPRQRGPTPARLHLITPSRPPLGMTVHCPGCGTPVDRDALQRFGTTTCPRCKRVVAAHIQRGRLTVIVEETADEAEYRKRMDRGS